MRRVVFVSALLSLAALAAPPKKLEVVSSPPGATVALDGKEVGATPLTVEVPGSGKHQLTFALEGFDKQTQRVDTLKDGARVSVELVDTELKRLELERKKAEAAYDKANARLEKAQEASQAAPDSNAATRALEKAEKSMEAASEALETAERALRKAKDARRTTAERAADSQKLKQALTAPPPPAPGSGTAAPPKKRSEKTVLCSWDEPVGDKGWANIKNDCFRPPVASATSECTNAIRARFPGIKPCDCTDEPAVTAKCQ